ncbi:hypothetical protein [Alkalihalobacterium alkalinitrilicum]|uniref:hypothetical protein n=1 Tax=Alkalihalobacterium alkalinitrilicum TaxID=427920 RepID=UPI000995A6CC|nr:hypothetical protein [Alkalihalobacterium alkalinitrilicum]
MEYRSKQQSSLLTALIKPQSIKDWALLIGIVALGAAFLIGALWNEIIFRLFVILFLVAMGVSINRKLNNVTTTQVDTVTVPEEQMEKEPVVITDLEVEKKQSDLKKVDLDRTLLLEELFSKAALSDMEKQQYRQKIKQKDNEISTIMQEMMNAKNKIQQAVLETKKYFIKVDPIKEIAASLDKESVLNGTIYDLNWALEEIRSSLPEDVIQALEKSSYVDSDFKLTRNGYKALVKEVGKKNEDELEEVK